MPVSETAAPQRSFRHEVMLYSTDDEFVARTTAFLRDGIARNEALLAVVDASKIRCLRAALGPDASAVQFADMARVGHNPARIIQAWRDFVGDERTRGRARRGLGEPVSAMRNAAALAECRIHESLLNSAFAADADFWLLCPYDTASLPVSVIEHAIENHPFVCDDHGHRTSGTHRAHDVRTLVGPLPDPSGAVATFELDLTSLTATRRFVTTNALEAGVHPERLSELAVAVSEIATNAVVYGDGRATVSVWNDDGYLLCEIRGRGHLVDPMVGQLRPPPDQSHGRGVWLANQLCDLVQIRSSAQGTIVRLHVQRT